MGIKIEFNTDLCLRAFGTKKRCESECLPEKLEISLCYVFRKEGQRLYWLNGEIPLRETKGNEQLSRPLASIVIVEYTHQLLADGKPYTIGIYEVKDIFDINDLTVHFEGFERVKLNNS